MPGHIQRRPPPHPHSSSQSTSRPSLGPGTQPARTTLMCVAYRHPHPHWGFFLPDARGDGSEGLLIHVGGAMELSGSSTRSKNGLVFKHSSIIFDDGVGEFHNIKGALLTPDEAIASLRTVYGDKGAALRAMEKDSQHFCIAGVRALQRGPCPGIKEETIREIRGKMKAFAGFQDAD